jgi:hypothetical protein
MTMASFQCRCGTTISLSEIPNSAGFQLLGEVVFEHMLADIVRAHSSANSEREFKKNFLRLMNARLAVQGYECSTCHRIAIFREASDAEPVMWFVRDVPSTDSVATSLVELLSEAEGQASSE